MSAKVVAFYSGEKGGTGKTTLSIFSSILLVENPDIPYKVVLVDLSIDMNQIGIILQELAKQVTYRYLIKSAHDEPGKYGLLDYLLGKCDIKRTLYQVDNKPLIIIPAGYASPEELKSLADFSILNDVFQALKQRNIFVIVDLPSMRLYEAIANVLKFVDDIIFVVEPAKEHVAYLKKQCQALEKFLDKKPSIKVILNKVKISMIDYINKEIFNDIEEIREAYGCKIYKVNYRRLKFAEVEKDLPEVLLELYLYCIKNDRSDIIHKIAEYFLSTSEDEYIEFITS